MIDQSSLNPTVTGSVTTNGAYRRPFFAKYNSSNLFVAGAVLVSPFECLNITQIDVNVISVSTGALLVLQTSEDGGVTWSGGSIQTVGNNAISIGGQQGTFVRISSNNAATAGTTNFTVLTTGGYWVDSYLKNTTPSVVSYSSSALSAANTVLSGPFWVAGFRSGLMQITSTATGATVQVQLSNDSVSWYAASCLQVSGNPLQSASLTSSGAYGFSTNGAMYARIVTTTVITAGTLSFSVSLSTTTAFSPQNAFANVTPIASAGVGNMISIVTAASNNLTLLKASNACVTGIFGSGAGAGKSCYLKMFNAASTGAVTMGTTVPLLNIGIHHPHSASFDCSLGLRFGTGLVVAITANPALLDNTSTAVGDAVWNLTWA